jgi:DNA-binding beta-propeller fold protein YncE
MREVIMPTSFNALRFALAAILCGAVAAPAAAQENFAPLFNKIADIPIGARTSRFDYESLDPITGRLFAATMGSAKLLVFDTRSLKPIVELAGFPKVTGVLAVPALHKVYASVPGAGIGASLSVAMGMAGLSKGSGALAILNSDTLKQIARLPAGVFPDGIAYDPADKRIFVSDELGDAVTVIGADDDDKPLARIDAGGEVGNVQYDPITGKVFAPVQSRDELAEFDPKTLKLVARYPLPGARHPHGLRIAHGAAIGYVACDENDRLLVVNLKSHKVIGNLPLGRDPDVLADDGASRLYVASESGILSAFDTSDPANPRKLGDVLVGDNAHSVAVDPATGRLFLPLRDLKGEAVMRILAPSH